MKIKKSWIRKNKNYSNFFEHHVGLEAPTGISTLTCFEEFEQCKQRMANANDDLKIRNSFWGNLKKLMEATQLIEDKTSNIPDPERLKDFEQKIREYFSSIPLLKKWFWFIVFKIREVFTRKRAFCHPPGKISRLSLTALALALAALLWFFMPQTAVPTAVLIKVVPPFNTVQSFNKDTNALTLSCEERNCYLSVLLPWKGAYQLGLKAPPECVGGIRLSVGKTTLNLVGAKRHEDVPEYFLIETGLFKIKPPINASHLRLQFFQLGNAQVEVSFRKIQ